MRCKKMGKLDRMSGSEIAELWKTKTTAAQGDYEAGIKGVTEAPGAKAAKKVDVWLQAIQNAKEIWKKNVNISLAEWQAAIIAKIGNFGTGVAATKKMEIFFTKFAPMLKAAVEEVNKMPDDTYEQRKAKMIKMIDKIHEMKGKII
jgi:hypothetical protein